MSPKSSLPKYEHPPVIETVIGVQYPEPNNFRSALLGAFWASQRVDYPEVQDLPPLQHVLERLGKSAMDTRVEVTPLPSVRRSLLVDSTKRWAIQVQADRFLHNWRRNSDEDEYPGFDVCFPRFEKAWRAYTSFLSESGFPGELVPNQLEMTYVNHIPAGAGWKSAADMGRVLTPLNWPANNFLPPPEVVVWQASFPLPKESGRLHVTLRNAVRTSDMSPVLLGELTARGCPPDLSEAGRAGWFALAREWIVKGFTSITTPEVQTEVWKRLV